jgi:TctA family transporter
MVFLERPISATLLAITAGIIAFALYSTERNRRRARMAAKKVQQEETTP